MSKENKAKNQPLSFDKLRKITEEVGSTIHFVGIGGVSMYSLAILAMDRGANVTGSDKEQSLRTRELVLRGAKISIGHDKNNVFERTLWFTPTQ